MNSTVYSVDPSNSTFFFFSYSNFNTLYKGQTSIIRFNMTLLDGIFYDIGMSFTSSIASDNYQIVRLFVSNMGVNFPCSSSDATVTFTNGLDSFYLIIFFRFLINFLRDFLKNEISLFGNGNFK